MAFGGSIMISNPVVSFAYGVDLLISVLYCSWTLWIKWDCILFWHRKCFSACIFISSFHFDAGIHHRGYRKCFDCGYATCQPRMIIIPGLQHWDLRSNLYFMLTKTLDSTVFSKSFMFPICLFYVFTSKSLIENLHFLLWTVWLERHHL